MAFPFVSTVLFPFQISAELLPFISIREMLLTFFYRDCKELRGVRGDLVISVATIMSIS